MILWALQSFTSWYEKIARLQGSSPVTFSIATDSISSVIKTTTKLLLC